jgi:hypothetical protein
VPKRMSEIYDEERDKVDDVLECKDGRPGSQRGPKNSMP